MKLEATVTAMRDLAVGVREFTFAARDGALLPCWEPGAHIQVLLPVTTGAGRRAYSLIGDPAQRDSYRIAVQYEAAGEGGSRYLHEKVAVGDRLVLASPLNAFELADPGHRPVELVAGGIGITPLIAMVRVLRRNGTPFRLTVFAREWARIPFRQILETEFKDCADLVVGEALEDNARRIEALAVRAARSGADVYTCGPTGFVSAVVQAAQDAGVEPGRVRFERFATPATAASGRAFRLHLARSGFSVDVPAQRSALEVLEEVLGEAVPCDCRVGYCGTCAQTVIAGQPEHRDTALGPADHAAGRICVCVSRAAGAEMTLDL